MPLIISIVVGILLAMTAGLVHIPPVRRFVLEHGEDYLKTSQQIDVQAGKLEYNVFGLTATLHDITIRASDPPQSPPFLTATRVYINLDATALLRGRFAVEEAVLEGVRIHLIGDDNGAWNLPRQQQDSRASPPKIPEILIDTLAAAGPEIVVEDRESAAELRLANWRFVIDGKPATLEHSIRFATEQAGQASFETRSLPVGELALQLLWKGDLLQVRTARLRMGASQVAIGGRIENLLEPVGRLSLESNLEVAELTRFITGREDMGGRLNARANLAESLSAPRISGRINGEALSFGVHEGIGFNANLNWSTNTKSGAVETLAIQSPYGNLEASGTIATSTGESSVEVSFSNVDLDRVSRQLELGTRISSTASGKLSARWPALNWKEADGQASVQLATRREAAKQIMPVRGLLNLTAGQGRFRLNIASLEALSAQASGLISLDRQENLGGTVQVEASDMANLLMNLDAFRGNEPSEQQLAGSSRVVARLAGTLDNPRIEAEIEAGPLSTGKVQNATLRASADYTRERARLSDAELSWRGQIARASGELGLADSTPTLNLKASGEGIEISPLLSAFLEDFPLEGVVDFSTDIAGSLESPSAKLEMTGHGLRAFGESWGQLSAEAEYHDGRIEIANLKLEKPGSSGRTGALQASGSYELEPGRYSLRADSEGIEFRSLTLPDGQNISGRFSLQASGEGLTSNPSAVIKTAINGLAIGERKLGNLELSAQVADRVAEATLSASRLGLQTHLRSSTQAPYPSEFDLKAGFEDLTLLALKGPDGEVITGALSGTIRGSGELENWKSLNVNARLEEAYAVVNQQKIRAEQPIEARLENGVIIVQPALILAGGAQLDLAGSLPLEAAHSTGEEFRLDANGTLESLLAFAPDLGNLSAKGNINARATLRGGLDKPEPRLTVSLSEGEIASPALVQPITGVQLEAETRDQMIMLNELTAQWAGATMSANASLPLGLLSETLRADPQSAQLPARFQFNVRDLNPGSIQGAPENLSGMIQMHAEGEAPSLELAALSAQARFDELRLSLGELDFRQGSPSNISLKEGLATIENFELRGGETRITASGTTRLGEPATLDVRVAGTTDASLFSSLTDVFRATGTTEFELTAKGALPEPEIIGSLQLKNGRIAADSPPLQGEKLNFSLRLAPGRLDIVEGRGVLNGGQLGASGFLSYASGEIKDIDLSLAVERMFLDFPQGLRTVSDTNLRITQSNDQILLGGKVSIAEGAFREPLDIGQILGSNEGAAFVEERDPLLSRIRYRVNLDTAGPIVIDNDLAKLMVSANLVLTGNFYRPAITGRLTIDEGGEIYLAEHDYIVDTGVIDFVNENQIEPSFNVLARTRASGHNIDLRITGSPGDLDTAFTSDTGLSEPDILSVLLTGRTLEEARGSGLNIAREHAMSYLTGQLGGRFSRAAEETLGLSRVRIEPNLVSGDSNPGARLTVGQDLRRDLRLIYSMNLVDSSDQILIGEYDLTRGFNIRGTNQSDNSRRFDFRHDLRFGGSRVNTSRRETNTTVGSIEFTGEPVFDDKVLLDKLGVKSGKRYDFFRLRRGLDSIEKFYRNNDYLEARVRLQQERGSNSVDMTMDIDAGPRVEFIYEGFELPADLRKQIREIWAAGVFDTQRSSDSIARIRRWFIRERYIEAEVLSTIKANADGLRRVLFEIQPGTRFSEVNLVFKGAQGVLEDRLEELIQNEPEGFVDSILNPRKVVELLTQYYRQHGYLSTRISRLDPELNPQTATANVGFMIEEGPLFRFGRIDFTGSRAIPEEQLRSTVTVYPNEAYQPERLRNSVEKLEEFYWSLGYNDVNIQYSAQRNQERREVDIQFKIDEQQQGVVERVEVDGNSEVGEKFIRGHLKIKEGDILDYKKTELSRRSLYKTGSFSLVELETETIASELSPGGERQKPLLLRTRIREVVPYKIRYGAFYDTDRGPGAIFDFENRNSLLGGARLLGFRSRYDSDLHEVRGYFGQPFSFKLPSVFSATTFRRREFQEAFTTDRIGFSLLHELELRENMVYSYGYRNERAHTYEKEPDPFLPFDETLRIAPLTTAFSWDRRDELLDATRGFFLSNALEYAPSRLGSDLRYIKYFGQFFKYIPLTEPAEVPFGRGLKRPRIVYAGGVRAGLARGFGGQSIVPSERFFTGGGTSVRGFQQNSLGEKDYFGNAEGGEAMFIANNELRFPLAGMFDGVGFIDIGNVYPRAADFNPFDVRGSAGAGLRVRTPYFLLRFDYGFKLDRQPGEKMGAFFFSIGQAF